VSLEPCSDVSAARWLTDHDRSWPQLVNFGPAGFAAYARVRFLADPAFDGQSENDAVGADDAPSETAVLRLVLETLARYTRTPDDCYFCLWDGWGSTIQGGDGAFRLDLGSGTVAPGPPMAPAFPPSVLLGPKVVVPHREYFLFRGPVSEVNDWGAAELWPGRPRPDLPNPAFAWPADRAWCVAKDVDPHWAGVGADADAIEALVDDPRFDAVRADPRADQPTYR
jgi:hypothetical protein